MEIISAGTLLYQKSQSLSQTIDYLMETFWRLSVLKIIDTGPYYMKLFDKKPSYR